MPDFQSAFVTGSTGLLGSNLVRMLHDEGVRVTALARDPAKAAIQFAGLDVEVVKGDLNAVDSFLSTLSGHDVLFHTAAEFRDAYKGGNMWDRMEAVNVRGTARLLEAARDRGIGRFVHASSTAVLWGERGQPIDETMLRNEDQADDYFRSKIQSEKAVFAFLDANPDMFGVLVLPGWMHGPGDMGPTSAGKLTLDYLKGALPGIPPGEFAFVDARDVAQTLIAAASRGRRGERYLAAGRSMRVDEVFAALQAVSGIPMPRRHIPIALLVLAGAIGELRYRLTGKAAMLNWASVRLLINERGRRNFNSGKAEAELGTIFRPVEETLRDEIAWYRDHADLFGLPTGKA